MARPRKTTFDAFVDAFCNFTIADQGRALELMNFEHRRARIRAARELPKPNGQPAAALLDHMEAEQ